jgi:hypothetical protein
MFNKFMESMIVGFVIMLVLTSCSSMVYHKPEFKGKIIDAETKEPIEGVVVAVYYQKSTIGGIEPIIHFAETLTDSNGDFSIPPFETIIHPLAHESRAYFIIYKPGYVFVSDFDPERLFSTEKSGQNATKKSNAEIADLKYGVAELKKLKTREERLLAIPGSPAHCSSKDLPLLFKLIDEEDHALGLKGVK